MVRVVVKQGGQPEKIGPIKVRHRPETIPDAIVGGTAIAHDQAGGDSSLQRMS